MRINPIKWRWQDFHKDRVIGRADDIAMFQLQCEVLTTLSVPAWLFLHQWPMVAKAAFKGGIYARAVPDPSGLSCLIPQSIF